HTAIARIPPRNEVGLIQLLQMSPPVPPAGTRPDAIAPPTQPLKKGTRRDEDAKAAPKFRLLRGGGTPFRNAKLAPRSTMPSAANVSGTNSVRVIDWNASGKPVHSTTSTKISHTWLASQTGPIAWFTTARGFAPCLAPPAMRSQNPAPKSAP